MSAALPLTVLVPTRNERDNVRPLLHRMPPCVDAVVFCDDSDDGTEEVLRTLVIAGGPRISVVHRPLGERNGGLAGAIVNALSAVDTGDVCIIDGDLQHPPEDIQALYDRRNSRTEPVADLIVAIRAGDIATSTMSPMRQFLSWFAGRTALTVFRRLPTVDPMSGFFLFDRAAVEIARLRPHGFKILLEILVTHRDLRVADVAYTFQPRASGQSKGTVREGLRFGRHVLRLIGRTLRGRR